MNFYDNYTSKKQVVKKRGFNPITAAVTGAVVGSVMKILNKVIKFIVLLLVIVMQFVNMLPIPKTYASSNPATVNLGTTDNFAAMAAAAISDTPTSVIIGDVGLFTGGGASITGLTCGEITGSLYETNSGYAGGGGCVVPNSTILLDKAHTDLTAAYDDAKGRTPNVTLDAGDNQLGGQTLTQGVYSVAAAATANIVGTLTLTGDADSVFIFQMSSTLVTANNSKVVLSGVQSCHVFWQVGSSATLNSSSTFVGNMLVNTTIVDSGSSSVDGRLLAGAKIGSGALTLSQTHITKSTCASPTTAPTATPTSTSGSSSSSSSGSGGSSSSTSTTTYPALDSTVITPVIIKSERVDADSISLSWGPYSGVDTFNVQYGLENGKWIYNTDVTGFTTTINSLPSSQPIWVRIAARNTGTIGTYGEAKLVGGPESAI